MKKLSIIIALAIVLLPVWGMAGDLSQEAEETDKALNVSGIVDKLDDITKQIKALRNKDKNSKCPIPAEAWPHPDMGCYKCHYLPTFEPMIVNKWTKIKEVDDEKVLYYYLTEIPTNELRDSFEYALKNGIKKVLIEIHSYGGSIYHAYRNVSLIEQYKKLGIDVETRVSGLAASAGFLIFMTGEKRLMSERAMIMWHEVQSIRFFFGGSISIETPSDKEEEARILRFLNDNPQDYIAERCNLSKEELDVLVKKRELWVRSDKAIEYGFATGLL